MGSCIFTVKQGESSIIPGDLVDWSQQIQLRKWDFWSMKINFKILLMEQFWVTKILRENCAAGILKMFRIWDFWMQLSVLWKINEKNQKCWCKTKCFVRIVMFLSLSEVSLITQQNILEDRLKAKLATCPHLQERCQSWLQGHSSWCSPREMLDVINLRAPCGHTVLSQRLGQCTLIISTRRRRDEPGNSCLRWRLCWLWLLQVLPKLEWFCDSDFKHPETCRFGASLQVQMLRAI